MGKYYKVFKLTLEEYFVYRLNFLLWRFRSFVVLLTLFLFWQAVLSSRSQLFGYQGSQLLTYALGIGLLRSLVLANRSIDLAGMIKSGDLVGKYLLHPWTVWKAWLARDAAAKVLDLIGLTLELALIIPFFRPPLFWPKRPTTVIFFLLSLALATLLYFFISYCLSLTAFWLDEIWAIRWLFGIIILEFASGAFFPLDILPQPLFFATLFTPFPYLVFFPLKIYLEQLSFSLVASGLAVTVFWLIVFWWASAKLWQAGLKWYSAYGG